MAEPKGKAKTLRQKDRIRTGLRKVRAKEDAHQRGNRCKAGNLSGNDGGRKTKGAFLSLFLRKIVDLSSSQTEISKRETTRKETDRRVTGVRTGSSQ